MGLGRRHRALRVISDRDYPIPRIVLDQIFERCRELRIVLNHQNLEHPNLPREFRWISRDLMLTRIESPANPP